MEQKLGRSGLVANERLRAARLGRVSPSGSGRPLSRRELADLVNDHLAGSGGHVGCVDESYIGKLERGQHRWPSLRTREAFRAVLGVGSDAELGFYIVRGPSATVSPAAAVRPLPPILERGQVREEIPDDVDGVVSWLMPGVSGARVSAGEDLAGIESARVHFEQMYRRVGGIPVRPRVEAFLRDLVAPLMLTSSSSVAGRGRLSAVAGVVAIAGVCCYDAEQHGRAQYYFRRALELAKAADDKALCGYVTALTANQAICIGQPALAIHHIDVALYEYRSWLSPALLTDLLLMKAKSYARLGQRAECLLELRDAENVYARLDPANEPSETGYFHPGLLELKSAEALLQIGELSEAQARMYSVVGYASAGPRSDVYAAATLAIVCAARRQVDESVDWVTKAFDSAVGMESWRIRERLNVMVKAVQPLRHEKRVEEVLGRYSQGQQYAVAGLVL